jgi:hypothetical protein
MRTRSLSVIAESIHSMENGNVVDIGDLLIEAKAQCEHGLWLDWLSSEFEWSADTAERYMNVAELCAKFRTLRNLKLSLTTLYKLTRQFDEDLPSIIDELAKHATKTRLSPADAKRVIKIGVGRRRFGDLPDATLLQLVSIDQYGFTTWHEQAVAELKENRPTTDESAASIVDTVRNGAQTLKQEVAEQEADAILDGPSPQLAPPTSSPEPQKLGATTSWPETDLFAGAVTDLLELRAKPIQRFNGVFSSAELREVSAFLLSVAAIDERKAA